MKRIVLFTVLLALGACQSDSVGPTDLTAAKTAVEVRGDMVLTPSGAVFLKDEWKAIANKAPYMEAAASIVERVQREQSRALTLPKGLHASISPTSPPRVLCHTFAFVCSQIPSLIPGTQVVFWNDSQWSNASVADFAQFDAIYIQDGAAYQPGMVASKDRWGTATTGRVALTGVHFEHCGGDPNSGPCRVLKASMDWIFGGTGTGLLMSTQSSPQTMPTVAPYAGVTYLYNGGGFDRVRITDPGHATMQGSTDASLSNFFNSSHSIFDKIGGFTSVAEICDVDVAYPSACPGTYHPHYLVTSVAVADQDGDGVPDATDNCPTVGNADQSDANGNGVGDACESAPTVTIDPKSSTIAAGGTVTFTATATDSDNPQSSLSYEWRVDGIVQSGATSATFTGSFTADATVRVTVRDPGNLSGFDDATVTIQTDNTPPAIAPTVTGTLGDNGWYTSDVSVHWAVTDDESDIASQTGCDDATVSADTDGQTFTCTATSAGGQATQSVTVKRDATAPTVSGAVSGTAGANGWFTSAVSVAWTTSDNLSGVVPNDCVTGYANETTGTSLTCAVKDAAGNTNSASVSFKIDTSAPVIHFSGATAYGVEQTVSVTCNVGDAVSGIATQSCPSASGPAYSFGPSTTLTASATNGAGLGATQSFSFQVSATPAGLCSVVRAVVTSVDVQDGLCDKLAAMAKARNQHAKEGPRGAFHHQVAAQTGKSISSTDAQMLLRWVDSL